VKVEKETRERVAGRRKGGGRSASRGEESLSLIRVFVEKKKSPLEKKGVQKGKYFFKRR